MFQYHHIGIRYCILHKFHTAGRVSKTNDGQRTPLEPLRSHRRWSRSVEYCPVGLVAHWSLLVLRQLLAAPRCLYLDSVFGDIFSSLSRFHSVGLGLHKVLLTSIRFYPQSVGHSSFFSSPSSSASDFEILLLPRPIQLLQHLGALLLQGRVILGLVTGISQLYTVKKSFKIVLISSLL